MPPLDTQVHVCATLQEARIIRDKLPPSHQGFFIVDAGAVRTRDGDTIGSILAKVPIEVWTALGVNTRNSWDTPRPGAGEDMMGGEMAPADDATTDDEGGRGSAKAGSSKGKTKVKAKAKNKGKAAQVGGAFGSSSRPQRAAALNRKCVVDADTDDDDDFEVGAGGDVSDEY